MVAPANLQTVADFELRVGETLDRINRTGEAELLTVGGEVRGVLLSPAAFDALQREYELRQDVTMLREGVRQADAGESVEASVFFARLRSELLARQVGDGHATGAAE